MTPTDHDDRRHGRRTDTADEAQAGATETRGHAAHLADTAAPKAAQHPGARAEKVRAPEAGAAGEKDTATARTRLFEETAVERYRVQWRELQAGFVDEPRSTVREAETLVNRMVESLTTQLDNERRQLRSGAETDDTERLRVVMQRYRALVDQLSAV
jgi:hypothetical protein